MSVLKDLYLKYGLEKTDMFPHAHYTIIKREGIEKIEAKSKVKVEYKIIACTETYCAMECITTLEGKPPITMFASAMNSPKIGKSCNNFYLLEMAQKRALSRSLLKNCGFYTLGHYSECEAEDFSNSKPKKEPSAYNKPLTPAQQYGAKVVQMKDDLDIAKANGDIELATNIYEEASDKGLVQVQDYHARLFENPVATI